ncbi:MAG: helix-turn-helix domain-containing protein [Pseudolabrys sp.]
MANSNSSLSLAHSILLVSIRNWDVSILKVSIRQLKAARTLVGWSQEELASAANVSLPTIKRLEAVEGLLGGRQTTAQKIQAALEKAGIQFIDENGGGPGVRLRKRQRAKQPK